MGKVKKNFGLWDIISLVVVFLGNLKKKYLINVFRYLMYVGM